MNDTVNNGKYRKLPNPAIRISIYYFIFGFLWILLSDRLLVWFTNDIDLFEKYQTYKGWFFILVTGLIFYFIASYQFKRMTHLTRKLSGSHHKLDNLMAGFSSGLLLLNRKDMSVIFINDYAENLKIDWELFIETFFDTSHSKRNYRLIDPDVPERARDLKFRNLEGKDIYLKLNSTPLKEERGVIREILVTFDDVSSHQVTEEELRRNEELQRILIQNIPNTRIWLFDKEMNILKSSQKDTLKEKIYDTLLPFLTNALKGFESDEEIEFEDKYFSIRTAPVRNDNNEIFAGVAILQDISLRKQSEKELKKRNLFIETLQDNLPVGVLVHKISEGKLLYTNRKFREFSGWSKEEIKNYPDFLEKIFPDPEYRQITRKKITGILSEGKPETLSMENISVDDGKNHLRKVSLVLIPLKEQDIIISSFIDNTEKDRAEQLLRETTRKYSGLFENSPLPLWEEDFSEVKKLFEQLKANGINDLKPYLESHPEEVNNLAKRVKIKDKNKAARELAKLFADPEVKHPFLAVSGNSPSLITEFDALFKGETQIDIREKVNIDGEERSLILRISVMPGFEDSLSHIMIAVSDVTEIQNIQDELREEKSRAEVAIEASKLGFWVANYATGENYINNRWAKMIGYSKKEVEESFDFFCRHLHPEDRETFQIQEILKNLKPSDTAEINFRMRHKEGHYIWIQSIAKPIEIDQDGNVVRALGTHRDITMDVEKEKELFRNLLKGEDKARQRIAAELHDSLGQYLSAASLNLQSIRDDVLKMKKEKADQYKTAMGFLKDSIEEVRNISANIMPPSISDFGLTAAIKSLIKRLQNTSSTNILYHDNLEEVKLDSETELNIFRVLQEALSNAIRHSEATTISVQLLKNNHILTLSVEDNGKGFDGNEVLKVTDGMGIRNMKNRARALDGKLSIETSPGKGTNIIVELNLE